MDAGGRRNQKPSVGRGMFSAGTDGVGKGFAETATEERAWGYGSPPVRGPVGESWAHLSYGSCLLRA